MAGECERCLFQNQRQLGKDHEDEADDESKSEDMMIFPSILQRA